MDRDKLIILETDFEDPAYPDKRFYCWHCILMEGVLAAFHALANAIDVERIPWPRPRQKVIQHIGEMNQSVPVLLLADNAPDRLQTGIYQGRRFVEGKDAILNVFNLRYGIPLPRP